MKDSYTAKDLIAMLKIARAQKSCDQVDEWCINTGICECHPIETAIAFLERVDGPNGKAWSEMSADARQAYNAGAEAWALELHGATARLYEQRDALVTALRRVVDASDQFVRDTGLKHGDLLTDAVDATRPLVGPGSATHGGPK